MAKKNRRCKICTENKNFAFCDDERCSNHAKDLLEKENIQKCEKCGCTKHRACENGCHWIEVDLCSACSLESKEL